uniref:Uncharacterized protein MANES_14G143400 n=1 Tax=Rhizophora mucronata TaxID=61149 RepID=A0A2P2KTX2_RHIMU
MAGITSAGSFLFQPSLTPNKTAPSLLSLKSNLFGLRWHDRYLSLVLAAHSMPKTVVTARYGRPSDSRRSRQSYSEEDQALDVSGVRSPTVRLIDENQNMVGVVTKNEAIQMAEDTELDLVIVSPEADPPVVRIMDYDKYRYEQQKKKRLQQKKSAANRMDLKELKMGYNIDQHDYVVRLKAAQKFLKDGDKVI